MRRTFSALAIATVPFVACNGGPQYIRTEADSCREWAEMVAKDAASNNDAPPFIKVACRGRGYTAPDAGTD